MIRLEIKTYNMILTKKHYYQIKLINMNLLDEAILPPNQSQIIEENPEKKEKTRLTFENTKKKVLHDFESKIFQIGK